MRRRDERPHLLGGQHRPVPRAGLERDLDDVGMPARQRRDDLLRRLRPDVELEPVAPVDGRVPTGDADDRACAPLPLSPRDVGAVREGGERLAQVADRGDAAADAVARVEVDVQVDDAGEDRRAREAPRPGGPRPERVPPADRLDAAAAHEHGVPGDEPHAVEDPRTADEECRPRRLRGRNVASRRADEGRGEHGGHDGRDRDRAHGATVPPAAAHQKSPPPRRSRRRRRSPRRSRHRRGRRRRPRRRRPRTGRRSRRRASSRSGSPGGCRRRRSRPSTGRTPARPASTARAGRPS